MNLPRLFQSRPAFEQQFSQGLGALLAADADIESSILVLANALFDKALFADLADRLEQRFVQLAAKGNIEAHYQPLFSQIQQQGLQALATKHRKLGRWELQYNPLRSFRPARAAAATVVQLQAPFNPAGFHFNQAFLEKETLWQGELYGRHLRLLYNKFPFVNLHGLLVLDAAKQQPQYLQAADHAYIWALLAKLSENIGELGFAYNSYGAYASVNHLHFQSFIRPALPIAQACWQHNGGAKAYPLRCHLYQDPDEAWAAIAALHAENQAYNLIYLPQKLYICPRQRQGRHPHPDWSHAFAWYEISGGFSCTMLTALTQLENADIIASLAQLNLG